MGTETRLERRLERSIARASSPRGAAIVIASVTTSITIVAAALIVIVDRNNFPTIGSGMWWAVQTVTTVGYGDHVPATAAGRIVASFVMLVGIGFVTVITASITGAFVERSRRQGAAVLGNPTVEQQLEDIIGRLERIEASLRS